MRGRTVPPQAPRFPPVIELNATTKEEAHVEAAALASQGMVGLWVIQILHDDGCNAATSQVDTDCHAPCRPAFVLMSLDAHRNFMQFDQRLRKAGQN